MFVCQNQPCGAQWSPDEVEIRNEGQGPLFRCPQCGARNRLEVRTRRDGTVEYRQARRAAAAATAAPVQTPAPRHAKGPDAPPQEGRRQKR
jgi:hypothetical protein